MANRDALETVGKNYHSGTPQLLASLRTSITAETDALPVP